MVRQKWSTEPCYRRGIQLREYTERIPVALTQYLRERQRLSVRTMDNGPQHPSTVDVIIHLQLYFQIIILLLKDKKIRTFWNYTNRKQDVCKIFTIYFYYVLIVANCGPTPVVERSVVNVDGTTLEGSIRYYQCTGGSVMEGEYNITCGQDGRWSDVRFYCRRTLKYDIFKIKWYSEFGILMLVWLKQCVFLERFLYIYFQPTVTNLRSSLEPLWIHLPVHWRATSPCTRAVLTRYRRGSGKLFARRMGCGQKSTCIVDVSTRPLLINVTYHKMRMGFFFGGGHCILDITIKCERKKSLSVLRFNFMLLYKMIVNIERIMLMLILNMTKMI